MKKLIFSIISIIFILFPTKAQQIAFPGAEGFGRFTKGGRNGKVIEVSNRNDSGSGSLRAAVEASGARTIVFRVSGNIELEKAIKIQNPYITIAGQTAPGDGICLKNYPLEINTNQVIVRYLRVRLGDESQTESDAVSSRYYKNIILDHLSSSWSIDETFSVYNGDSTTVQWCLVSESLYKSNHTKGNHGYGAIWGGNQYTYHHNLLAHHSSRNPRFSSGAGYTDYVNNVIYNWGYMSTYGAEEKDQDKPDRFYFAEINMRNNYYKPGPATSNHIFARPSTRNSENDLGKWYVEGNYFYGNPKYNENNWEGITPDDGLSYTLLIPEEPFNPMPTNIQTAEDAYLSILANVGATLPKRDTVDKRIIDETSNQYATFEGASYETSNSVPDKSQKCGIIDSQEDVGGWPVLKSIAAPNDTDHDGMPDDWEDKVGLNKSDASDRNNLAADGYTMLEKYLNSIEFNQPITETYYELDENANAKIFWSDNYIGEDGFIILKSSDGNIFNPFDTVATNTSTYTDSSSIDIYKLHYRVVAFQDSFKTPVNDSNIKITDLSIDLPDTVYERETIKPMVKVLPETAPNRAVLFSIRDEDKAIATLHADGSISGNKPGKIEITITSLDGSNISETKTLTIKDIIEVTEINIEIDDTIIVGKRAKPEIEISPSDASFPSLIYSIRPEDKDKARVSSSGTITGKNPGIIKYTIHTSDGSGYSKTLTLNIVEEPISTKPVDFSESYKLNVFPNPFKDQFTIAIQKPIGMDVCLSIYNNIGNLVFNETIESAFTHIPFNGHPPGIYALLISSNGKHIQKSIIKEK